MKKLLILTLIALSIGKVSAQFDNEPIAPRVTTGEGILEGLNESGIRTFKGIPFAQPPVGDLRWKEPQPVKSWTGVRKASKFGPRAMQLPLFGDMNFRSDGMSEDCLYLNVWTPAKTSNDKLPVLVYFYGGGFVAGDGSEPRYDGESMARKGIVTITVNYRLSVFGFFAHPELTKESEHHASGNYGLLDQHAALQWVKRNIAAFGGDPSRVTIAGESAGSFSVSAQMASPLSKDLFASAIGESGSLLGSRMPVSLTTEEQNGTKFTSLTGAGSLAALRAMTANELLQATAKANAPGFNVIVDGYFLPKSPLEIYAKGEQSKVPLLVGWNSEESGYKAILGQDEITPANYRKAVEKLYGDKADEVLRVYPGATEEEIKQSATDLASDRFIAFSTWKWADMQAKTGGKPVYRYRFFRPRPAMRPEMGNAVAGLAGGVIKGNGPKVYPATGAVHSAEIEYALGNLPTNRVYDWQPEDYKVSEILQVFFANFVKNANPNGLGVPSWPAANEGATVQVMNIDVNSKSKIEKNGERYILLDKYSLK